MGLFRRKKEPPHEQEVAEGIAMADASRQTLTDSEMVFSLGRSIYMIHDPDLAEDLRSDPQLKNMYPAFSFLNRTVNINQKDKELLLLDYEFLLLVNTLNMNEDDFDNNGWNKITALEIFSRFLVNDPLMGWKGKLVTEQIKTIRTEVTTKKKGGIFG